MLRTHRLGYEIKAKHIFDGEKTITAVLFGLCVHRLLCVIRLPDSAYLLSIPSMFAIRLSLVLPCIFNSAAAYCVCVFSQHAFYVSKFDLFNPVFSFSQCVCVRVFIFIMARFHFTIKWDSQKTNSMLAHSVFVFRAWMRADFSGFHWFYAIVAEEQRLEKLESAP